MIFKVAVFYADHKIKYQIRFFIEKTQYNVLKGIKTRKFSQREEIATKALRHKVFLVLCHVDEGEITLETRQRLAILFAELRL